ncbi:MAG: CGLD27 family protein [Calothrix sp. SM1_7_51]|nr:CGLD27 family protein [Calothrix sp. SM1_7_51]
MMKSSVSYCPVPSEQQPVNEYEELKTSWFFSYCVSSWGKYLRKLGWVFGFSWLIAAPVAASSFPTHKYLGQFILSSFGGASLGVILILLRLYLGWTYVRDRLTSPIIFYEESGWHDGQTWTKPEEVLTRDKLIVSYEIKPILQRLQITFGGLALSFLIGTIIWYLL